MTQKKIKFGLAVMASLSALAATLLVSTPALSYGTVNELGQNSEHGRITRQALSCVETSAPGTCFEEKTLNSLAGKKGSFGAVGAPDRGRGMLTSYAHCSGGDYFNVPGYPQSKSEAQQVLTECRTYMLENLEHAVEDAADLLDDEGQIKSKEVSMFGGCIYTGSKHGRAKCNILAHMGRILHASQDFYSHSNWVDRPDYGRPISVQNPPGLGNQRPAPWLDLRIENPAFPKGLISGCFDMKSFANEDKGCLYGDDKHKRVKHLFVNKDLGLIGPVIEAGTTPRGAINENFQHSVRAAIADSADKWRTYRELLVNTYGPEKGAKMICALTHDKPSKSCSD